MDSGGRGPTGLGPPSRNREHLTSQFCVAATAKKDTGKLGLHVCLNMHLPCAPLLEPPELVHDIRTEVHKILNKSKVNFTTQP